MASAFNGISLGLPQVGYGTENSKNQGRKRNAKNLGEDTQDSATISKVTSIDSSDPSQARSLGLQHRAELNAQQRIERAKISSTDVLADSGEEGDKNVFGFLRV